MRQNRPYRRALPGTSPAPLPPWRLTHNSPGRASSGWLYELAFIAIAGLVAAACGGAANSAAHEDTALPVTTIVVEPVDVRRQVEAVGTLAARDEAVVSAEVEARVDRVTADMGDRVAAGAPLVVLDGEKLRYRADEQRAAVNQARARLGARGDELPAPDQTPDVISARARRTEAEQNAVRARQLAARNLLSAQDLERAETLLQTAHAEHDAARAAARHLLAEIAAREATLKSASREVEDAIIRAPFDGVVAERLVSAGQFVRVQSPVMRIVRLHPLRLTAQIPERFAPDIRLGQSIIVRVDAYPDRAVEGRVTRISPDVEERSRAFSIEAEVPNADGTLKPGTFARVRIMTDRVEKLLVVPATAVQTRYGRNVVFIVRGDTLSATEVQVGNRLGARVEITGGLEAGATIVSDGVEGLADGQTVTPRAGAAPVAEDLR